MFDLAADRPAQCGEDIPIEPNSAIRFDGDFLSDDFCILAGEDFFVRGVLEIPVHGAAEKFGFGSWSTLSRKNFDIYVAGFDDGGHYADDGPWFGWFSTWIKGYVDQVPFECWVYPQPDRQRPTFVIDNDAHPLAMAQEDGISAEKLLEIYASYGHEVS
ncbi:hypothetical protein SAMN02745824_1984 [Parasphingorhabdus marina DSM 22363]|uniref:DUF2199 domain-containing protein n=2 Tax=Parasphingorhabdus marina TaxID=394732 RepID=A0A1N6ELA1_9SPHN|nr:hypothetical protein SAMN02745824_1984 [Parasphingorhabdus marina DSM 22363]